MKTPVVSLQQSLDYIPIGSKQNIVSVFGIVSGYDGTKKELTIYDKSRDVFRVEVNSFDGKTERIVDEKFEVGNDKRKRIVLRVGDVVYIQKLVVSSDFTFKAKFIKDLMIFDATFNKIVGQTLHGNVEPTDDVIVENVQKLQSYHIKQLFEMQPQKRSYRDDYLHDIVFEVLYIDRLPDRTVLVGWNGNVLKNSFKSENIATFDKLWYGISLDSTKSNTYDYDFLNKIFKDELLLNITVFEPFLYLSDNIRLFDYVYMPRVLITPSKYASGKFHFRYNSALRHIRSIRICEPDSPIAKELSSKIEEYFLIEDPPLDDSIVNDQCRLSPIPCEKRNNLDEEFVSQSSYFPTSTPIKNTPDTSVCKKRSVLERFNVLQFNSTESFTESQPNESSPLTSEHINERLIRSLFELIRANYPFDLHRYSHLLNMKAFPESPSSVPEKQYLLIDALYGGFIKFGDQKSNTTVQEFDVDYFRKHVLLVKCSQPSCGFQQTICDYYQNYEDGPISDDLFKQLFNNFYCQKCDSPEYSLTISLSFKVKDRANQWHIIHVFDDSAEKLFAVHSNLLRSDLDKVYNNIRVILLYLDYYSLQHNYCRSFVQWIVRPVRVSFEAFPRYQVVDLKAKPSVSVGHRL